MANIESLYEMARDLRIDIIRMLTEAGNGHPGGSLSLVEILTSLYGQVLTYDPKNPDDPKRDRMILSKGHGVPALYAVLRRQGVHHEDLLNLRKLGSALQGHPDRVRLPGIEASTGSLGQGLSVAIGMALSCRLDSIDNYIYCVMGDGEIQEGQVWEAALSAPMHKLDRLIAVVDWNKGQIDGLVKDVLNVEPIAEKFASFGWHTLKVNGHSIKELLDAFAQAKKNTGTGKPTMIVADTIKGRGVSFMESDTVGWHGVAPTHEQAEQAIREIQSQVITE